MFIELSNRECNLAAIATLMLLTDDNPLKSNWPDWTVGVVMLMSGKEFAIGQEDYTTLKQAIKASRR